MIRTSSRPRRKTRECEGVFIEPAPVVKDESDPSPGAVFVVLTIVCRTLRAVQIH